MTEGNDKINGRRKSGVLWYIFALTFVFLAIFSAIFISSRAYAATIPEIFMGIFSDEYKGSSTGIAQQPATGDIITTPRTVVIKDSKWRLRPGYELKEAETSDAAIIKLVKTKKRFVRIKAMEAGTATVTITGAGGETDTYELIVEDPQVKSLKVVDFVRFKESRYITGIKYLKPTSVSSSKRKIAQIYKSTDGKNIVNVFGSSTTKITVKYGDYKRKGTIDLVGDETYDSLSYGLEISDRSGTYIKDNDGSDTIYFNAADHGIYIYEPGDYKLTLTQGIRTDSGDAIESIIETDDGFKCDTPVLTKTIRITRNTDGSIGIEEI